MFETLRNKIFIRIYAGLIVVCVVVAIFAQVLIDTINQQRIASYRDNMANSVFSLVVEGIAKQDSEQARNFWISDAGSLFGFDFILEEYDSKNFTNAENRKLSNNQSLTSFDDKNKIGYITHKLLEEDTLLKVQMDEISEQQARAFAIFLLEDLSYYPNKQDKERRLAKLSQNFSFPVKFTSINEVPMDDDQLLRLRRNEIVMQLQNSPALAGSSFKIIIPSEINGMAITVGPVGLFNWFPLRLVAGVLILSLLLISFGVYVLMYPLEKKIQMVKSGLDAMGEGKMDIRVPVTGQDEISRLAITFNSMAEHIKRLIESQKELTRAVSHELRTPVARIRFAVDMLADTEEEASRMRQRDDIDNDIESLNGLIDEILTYAKLEEGSPKLGWEMVSLKELVDQVVKETNALGKPIQVVGLPPIAKIRVQADKRYLHRVIQNFAGNALRYADTKVIVRAGVQNGLAFVSVEDDGQGIAEKDRDKVFTPFARLDDSRTRASGGYGLGLSIVSRIAFWFNGTVNVDESPELGGAMFTMRWPQQQITKAVITDASMHEVSERQLLKGETELQD